METTAALVPLHAITEAGAAVVIVHHPRKSDGAQGTAARGSGAISGFVDIIADRYILIHQGVLRELNDPQVFYDMDLIKIVRSGPLADGISHVPGNEEEILERIIKLETLLAEDKARKNKFQKPKMQAAWAVEIEKLNSKL